MAAKPTALDKAIRIAGKKLPFKSAKQTNEMLEMFVGDFAEAYRVGAEEAQREIVARLVELRQAETAEPTAP